MTAPAAMPAPPDFHVADPAARQGITLQGVTKTFQGRKVLDGLDFSIARGETVVIIGRSGEGKSVLLKHIVRLLEPDAGSIWVDGAEVTTLPREGLFELRKRFGMLFQGAALFDSMTICENVGLGLSEHSGLPPDEVRARACRCLAMVGLAQVEDKLPSELSGGMKKRAGLARAIAMEPDYILYDEPTTGLDPVTAMTINRLIVDLNTRLATTSVVVTHDIASALFVADRIAFLEKGRFTFVGSPDEARRSDVAALRAFLAAEETGTRETAAP